MKFKLFFGITVFFRTRSGNKHINTILTTKIVIVITTTFQSICLSPRCTMKQTSENDTSNSPEALEIDCNE